MPRSRLFRRLAASSSHQLAYLVFFGTAVISWLVMSELELFERFYEFSRAHEEWDLDEVALLIVNLALALIVSGLYQARRQRGLMRRIKQEQDRANTYALRDPLTSLYNRRALTQIMEEAAAELVTTGPRFIAMLDLDRFKPINDLRGHAVGDATLQGVARRLEERLSPECLLARLGGDEFAIVFRAGMSDAEVERAMRSLLEAFDSPFRFDTVVVHISASIGLARWSDGISISDVLARADKALYTAKSEGRARYAWYDEELDRKSSRRARIETDLRAAIQAEEIEPWFQPIVDIEDGTVIGFEVLARWYHRELGEIPPVDFIAVAEDSNQIGGLGNLLLRRALSAAQLWDGQMSISFNISPLQFQDPGLVNGVARILRQTRFDAARLTLEVTESSIIRDINAARAKLNALKGLGIKVALDDFGTGYSSLASLRELPFDRIKIDRGFVTGIGTEVQNQKIVTGIMALARGLELEVTAEGIESETDLRFLRSLNCSLGQGFLFDRALPASKVARFMASQWPDETIVRVDTRSGLLEARP